MFKTIVKNKIDILFVSEAKLDDSFLIGPFCIDRFTILYRLDRYEKGEGITPFVREDIPSKSLTDIALEGGIENMLLEINLRSKK